MGGKISVGTIPDRLFERLHRTPAISAGAPLFAPPVAWSRVPDADRFDRALAEGACVPLTLGFHLGTGAGDIDRLRIELESLLLRVPVLRARPLQRIEITVPAGTPLAGLAEFTREIRHPFRRASAVPIAAFVPEMPNRDTLDELRRAGCAHLWIRTDDPAEIPVGALHHSGFVTVGCDVAPENLSRVLPQFTPGSGESDDRESDDRFDVVRVSSPIDGDDRSEPTLRTRIENAWRGERSLREGGYHSPGPRRWLRREGTFDPCPYREEGARLEFGPGAIRVEGSVRWWNGPDRNDWAEAIDHGQIPPGRCHRSDEAEHLRRRVVHALLCRGSVDVIAIERDHGIDFIHHFQEEMGALEERQYDGLIECDYDRIDATPLGRLLIEDVAVCFDPRRRTPDGFDPTRPSAAEQ